MGKYILIIKKSGKAVKISSNAFPIQELGKAGVKAVTVARGDEVVAAIALDS